MLPLHHYYSMLLKSSTLIIHGVEYVKHTATMCLLKICTQHKDCVDAPWAHNVKDCTEVHLKYTTKRPSGQHLVQGVSLILILERGLKLTNRGQGVL